MNLKIDKIYPDPRVELITLAAKNYDNIINITTLEFYRGLL
ncbi:MAG: hypothetical protein U9N54_06475 [candidate division Zixibacteria bacterium]|nr:hypothetical protein [candidate division Zixibacteria bacterium]